MTRHELLPAQTATPPSRPAKDLAPLDGGIVITFLPGHICRGKFRLNGLFIATRDPKAAALSHGPGGPKAGQIQKNP
jgi:hypothetical protein